MELHELAAEIKHHYLSDRRIAFYVAAGVSKDCPTHLPLGRELGQAVLSGFVDMLKGRELSLLREAAERRSLEEICGIIQYELKDKGQLITKMSRALDSDELIPNYNHRFLAGALHDGHLVVTTNYDSMIERAYRESYWDGFPTERICYDGETFEKSLKQWSASTFSRSTNEPGWLLKLHGTFHLGCLDKRLSVMTTLDRVGQGLPRKAEDTLILVSQNCPLIVLGYGCMDIDIVYPVLEGVDSSQPIWWVKHEDGMTHIYDYDQLQGILRREKAKNIRDVDVGLLNTARVLCNRGTQNKGKVWQIRAPTSQVIQALIAEIGGSFRPSVKSCAGEEEPWKDELRRLGCEASHSEKLHVLAKLAQACGPYKPCCLDVYDLSDRLFKAALKTVEDNCDKSRIYREMGWNSYRKDPERNCDKAVALYDRAERLLPQDSAQWVSRIMIESLKALAYRRARRMDEALRTAEETRRSLLSFIRSSDLPSESNVLRSSLKGAGVEEGGFGLLGSALRRLAGVFDQCVAGPATLATAIRCDYRWKRCKRESDALRRAKRLLETDRELQRITGEPMQKIQSEHHLGLVHSKLGEGAIAMEIHEDSCKMARHFGRLYEYAQALRNRALAEEVVGRLDKAILSLQEAMHLFEGREDDVLTTLWHLGRIRIKNKDKLGLEDIEKHERHRRTKGSWHWRANDCALLGIGHFDIEDDLAAARGYFASMIKQYTDRKDADISDQTYGVDNALANVIAATERLGRSDTAESLEVCTQLAALRQRLERLRFIQLRRLSSSQKAGNNREGYEGR